MKLGLPAHFATDRHQRFMKEWLDEQLNHNKAFRIHEPSRSIPEEKVPPQIVRMLREFIRFEHDQCEVQARQTNCCSPNGRHAHKRAAQITLVIHKVILIHFE